MAKTGLKQLIIIFAILNLNNECISMEKFKTLEDAYKFMEKHKIKQMGGSLDTITNQAQIEQAQKENEAAKVISEQNYLTETGNVADKNNRVEMLNTLNSMRNSFSQESGLRPDAGIEPGTTRIRMQEGYTPVGLPVFTPPKLKDLPAPQYEKFNMTLPSDSAGGGSKSGEGAYAFPKVDGSSWPKGQTHDVMQYVDEVDKHKPNDIQAYSAFAILTPPQADNMALTPVQVYSGKNNRIDTLELQQSLSYSALDDLGLLDMAVNQYGVTRRQQIDTLPISDKQKTSMKKAWDLDKQYYKSDSSDFSVANVIKETDATGTYAVTVPGGIFSGAYRDKDSTQPALKKEDLSAASLFTFKIKKNTSNTGGIGQAATYEFVQERSPQYKEYLKFLHTKYGQIFDENPSLNAQMPQTDRNNLSMAQQKQKNREIFIQDYAQRDINLLTPQIRPATVNALIKEAQAGGDITVDKVYTLAPEYAYADILRRHNPTYNNTPITPTQSFQNNPSTGMSYVRATFGSNPNASFPRHSQYSRSSMYKQ